MQSFLVVAKEKDKASVYVSDFLKEKGIDPIDIDLQIFEKAMGIEDVRNIHKKILLRPFKGKVKAVIIDAYADITAQAQNALLKVLEEPPPNTIIIISTGKKEMLLPTIISRCKIIELNGENLRLSKEESTKYLNILMSLSEKGMGYKLKLAQDIAKSTEVVVWLEKMSLFVRKRLIENHKDTKYLIFLKLLQTTYKTIKSTNVNQRIALENLFLSI